MVVEPQEATVVQVLPESAGVQVPARQAAEADEAKITASPADWTLRANRGHGEPRVGRAWQR
jgi:hypothetical protein